MAGLICFLKMVILPLVTYSQIWCPAELMIVDGSSSTSYISTYIHSVYKSVHLCQTGILAAGASWWAAVAGPASHSWKA